MSGVQTRYRFGRFSYDPTTGELDSSGRRIGLQPQPARLLTELLRRPGELLSREELQAALWPDSKVEFDQGLNFCVRQIRAALGEAADTPVFIETLPRRGYRFIAPVEVIDIEDAGGPAQVVGSTSAAVDTPDPHMDRPLLERTFAIFATLTAVAVVTTMALRGAGEGPVDAPAAVVSGQPLVAVLPLTVQGTGDTTALATAARVFGDQVITELTDLSPQRLGVIARRSAWLVHDQTGAPSPGADELGADFLIVGSLSSALGVVTANVRMERASDGRVLWAFREDQPLADLSATSADVAARVVGEVAEALLPGESYPALRAFGLERPQRDQYLRARYLIALYRRATVEQAGVLLDSILAVHPDFVPALSGRALIAGLFDDDLRARALAQRALAIDETAHEAHWVIADEYLDSLDWTRSREHYERALELAPGVADYHRAFAFFHAYQGRHAEALADIRRALELDPVAPVVRGDLGTLLLAAGEPRRAIEACELSLKMFTEPSAAPHRCLLRAYLTVGDRVAAAGHARALGGLAGAPPLPDGAEDALQAYWTRQIETAREPPPDAGAWISLAEAAAALDQPERALSALESAERADPRPLLDAAGNPLFRVLAEEDRWRALLARIRPEPPAP